MFESLQARVRRLFERSDGQPSPLSVVALLRNDRDRITLRDVGERERFNIHFADTCSQAWATANKLRSQVVVCDRQTPNAEWRDTVRLLASAEPHPCVILASSHVDDSLWNEMVATGGYAVVATPLQKDETEHCIRLALIYWKSAMAPRP